MKKAAVVLLLLVLTGCRQRVDKPVQTDPPEPVAERIVPESQAPVTVPAEVVTEPAAEPADDALVLVAEYIGEIREELAYATEGNFTGEVIYDFSESYLRYGTVKKLMLVSEELAQQGLGLLIWDAFRPVAAQQKLWDICPDPAYVSHPVTGNRSHCRGNAVDVTLVDLETGEQLAMPTAFDDFSALADRDYSDCTEESARNARLLEETMEKYGFRPYSAEWWHFADTEDYPVEEAFDPAGVG